MELMNDEQLRRFMYNLCKYHEEKDVELTSDFEKAIWFGIEPALKTNNKKYEARAEKSRENGKLGGAPLGNQNARKEDAVQNNLKQPKQPKQPDNREEISEKGKEINDNSEMIKDNWQEKNEKTGIEEVPNRILKDIFCNYIVIDDRYKNYVLTKNDYRKVLTAIVFDDFPDWENKLNELGVDKFIPTYARYFGWPLMQKRFLEFTAL